MSNKSSRSKSKKHTHVQRTAFLNPSYLVKGLQSNATHPLALYLILISTADAYLPSALRLTSAIQHVVTPKQTSSSDFWEEAKKYEHTLQNYIPRMLKSAAAYFKSTKFTTISSAMNDIVRATATFRNSIQGALDAHHVTLDGLTQELETIFMSIVHDMENMPHPDKAPGHTKREEMVDKILDDTEAALVKLATRYGINVEVVTTYLDALRPQLHLLIVAVGTSISPRAS